MNINCCAANPWKYLLPATSTSPFPLPNPFSLRSNFKWVLSYANIPLIWMRFCKGKDLANTLGCDLERKIQPLLLWIQRVTVQESYCTITAQKVVEEGPAYRTLTWAISLQGPDRCWWQKHHSAGARQGVWVSLIWLSYLVSISTPNTLLIPLLKCTGRRG